MKDLFLTSTQIFTSQDINYNVDYLWIFVMFLAAFWIVMLTAPIHCRATVGEQVM